MEPSVRANCIGGWGVGGGVGWRVAHHQQVTALIVTKESRSWNIRTQTHTDARRDFFRPANHYNNNNNNNNNNNSNRG